MTAFSTYFRTAIVAIGAVALSASLMIASFSSDPVVQSLGGIVA
jgi:hypothetical protein